MKKVKKAIAYILMGLLIIVITSGNSIAQKSNKKKQVLVKKFSQVQFNSNEVTNYIRTRLQQNWRLIQLSGVSEGSGYSQWILIMEK